eukprot:gene25969-11654_t
MPSSRLTAESLTCMWAFLSYEQCFKKGHGMMSVEFDHLLDTYGAQLPLLPGRANTIFAPGQLTIVMVNQTHNFAGWNEACQGLNREHVLQAYTGIKPTIVHKIKRWQAKIVWPDSKVARTGLALDPIDPDKPFAENKPHPARKRSLGARADRQGSLLHDPAHNGVFDLFGRGVYGDERAHALAAGDAHWAARHAPAAGHEAASRYVAPKATPPAAGQEAASRYVAPKATPPAAGQEAATYWLQLAGSGLQLDGCSLMIAACGLQLDGSSSQLDGCSLHVAGCWLQLAGSSSQLDGCSLHVAGCWLQLAPYWLLVAACTLLVAA